MNKRFTKLYVRLTTLLLAATLCVGCNVDDSYDLSDVNTDGLGFGTDDTEFYMPLISVIIDPSQSLSAVNSDKSVAEIVFTKSEDETETTTDIFGNLSSINAILPDREVDLTLLSSDESYLSDLVDDLMFEIAASEDKSKSFCDEIYGNSEYEELCAQIQLPTSEGGLGVDLNPDSNPSYYTDLQAALPSSVDSELYGSSAIGNIKGITSDLICDLVVSNTVEHIEAGVVNIGSDTFDLLNDNLDGDKNTLRLFATFETDLDLDVELTISIIYSGENKLYVPSYLKDAAQTDDAEPITGELLEAILANLEFEVGFGIKNYDPSKTIDTDGKFIKLTFIAFKTGSIKL